MAKNECLKERKVNNPYEVWHNPQAGWVWRVLKNGTLGEGAMVTEEFIMTITSSERLNDAVLDMLQETLMEEMADNNLIITISISRE